MNVREFFGRVMAWRKRDELSAQLSVELQEHVHLLARDFEQKGMSRADAFIAAQKRVVVVAG